MIGSIASLIDWKRAVGSRISGPWPVSVPCLSRSAEAEALLAGACRDPTDGGIQKEMRAVRGTVKEERRAEAQMFRGRLGPSPSTAPPPEPDASAATTGGSSAGDTHTGQGVASKGVVGLLAQMLGFGYGVVSGMLGWLLRLRRT